MEVSDKYFFTSSEDLYTLSIVDVDRFTIDKNNECEVSLSEMLSQSNLEVIDFEENEAYDSPLYEEQEIVTPIFRANEHIDDHISFQYQNIISGNVYYQDTCGDWEVEISDDWDKNIEQYFKELKDE